MKPTFRWSFAIFALIFLGACSGNSPQKELERNQYRLSSEDFARAAGRGDDASVILFLQAGMLVNATDSRGRTALMEAARSGQIETVRLLLKAGADPKLLDQNERDALMEAAAVGNASMAELLLSQGANPENRDKAGWTALSLAAHHGHGETVKLFASRLPKPHLNEALLLACNQGSLLSVSYLLDAGAEPGTKSPGNLTPLMIAAQKGHQDMVNLLLSKNADPNQTGRNGTRAVHHAQASGQEEIAKQLGKPESHGEDKTIVKPLAALHGSVIRSRSPQIGVLNSFRVGDYKEFSIPLALSDVVGEYAIIRRTDSDGRVTDLKLLQGQIIPGTPYRLEKIESPQTARESGTAPYRVRVEHLESGTKHLLVKTSSERPQDAFAILVSDKSSRRFLVKAGDLFSAVDHQGFQTNYEVVEIGPDQVSVKDLTSQKTLNIMGKLEKGR